jgi:hypothetical protein
MTRRDFLRSLAATPSVAAAAPARVIVPLHRVTDSRARCTPEQINRFWWKIWPEAVATFAHGGIALQTSDGPGRVRRTAGDTPIFDGLRRGMLNLVLTDHIPMKWDRGRALAGATTIFDGYHVSLIALQYAHGNQVPFFSVNTCVHEMLHALLQDVFVSRPNWFQGGGRESRTDWYATSLWLFHNGAAVRRSARGYLERLRASAGAAVQ